MSSIIYGLIQISIYSLSQPPPAKAVYRNATPCIGANEPNHHPPHPFTILFSLTLLISKLCPPLVIDTLPFSLGCHICHVTEDIHMLLSHWNPHLINLHLYAPFSHMFSPYCVCHVIDHTCSCLRVLIFAIVLASACLRSPVCVTHNTRQCQPT